MKAHLILISVWYKSWIDYVIFWHARKLMTVYPVLLQNNCRILKIHFVYWDMKKFSYLSRFFLKGWLAIANGFGHPPEVIV